MSQYDVIVLGGGHNGLAAATVLAKAGRSIALVEQRSGFGGLAQGEEFHPGYWSPGVHHDTTQVRNFVIEALQLETFGLKRSTQSSHWITDRQGNAIHSGGEAQDQTGLAEFQHFLSRARPLLENMLSSQPIDVMKSAGGDWMPLLKPGLTFRRMGGNFMMEVFRVPPMCVADWVSEYVTDERLRASLAYDGIIRSFTGPWSPGTAGDLLIHGAMNQGNIQGGAQAVATALEQAAKAAGVTLLPDHKVLEITFEGERVSGVRTQNQTLGANTVVATCDPRHTVRNLLDPAKVHFRLEHHATHYRGVGIGAKLHLALNAPTLRNGETALPLGTRLCSGLHRPWLRCSSVTYARYAPLLAPCQHHRRLREGTTSISTQALGPV
jgi:phytoene dehydrogenase-like protein